MQQFNRWNTNNVASCVIVILVVVVNVIDAFTPTGTTTIKHIHQISSSSLSSSTSPMLTDDNNNSNNNNNNKRTNIQKMSIAIPFISCPIILQDNIVPGNNGFDPLQLCQSNDDIIYYRECEIRHSRLAMLACIGWPISEIYNNQLSNYLDMPSLLDNNNRVPNLMNGGLVEHVSPVFWGCCLGLTAAIEQVAITTSRKNQNLLVLNENDKDNNNNNNNNGYYIGNLGFDPLNLYPKSNKERQYSLQLSEIKHGRIAMIAITIFVVQEYITQTSIV